MAIVLETRNGVGSTFRESCRGRAVTQTKEARTDREAINNMHYNLSLQVSYSSAKTVRSWVYVAS